MTSPLQQFLWGLAVPVRGVAWLTDPVIRRLACLPLLFAAICSSLLFIVLIRLWTVAVESVLGLVPPSWLSTVWAPVIRFSAEGFIALAGVFMMALMVYALTQILLAPVSSWIAEHVLRQAGLVTQVSMFRMVVISCLNGLVLLAAGLIFLLFMFVPGLNFFAQLGVLLVAAYSCLDYALEARGLGFRERVRYMQRHLPAYLGLALAFGVLALVPGLSLLMFPILVAGGADLVGRLQTSGEDR